MENTINTTGAPSPLFSSPSDSSAVTALKGLHNALLACDSVTLSKGTLRGRRDVALYVRYLGEAVAALSRN